MSDLNPLLIKVDNELNRFKRWCIRHLLSAYSAEGFLRTLREYWELPESNPKVRFVAELLNDLRHRTQPNLPAEFDERYYNNVTIV